MGKKYVYLIGAESKLLTSGSQTRKNMHRWERVLDKEITAMKDIEWLESELEKEAGNVACVTIVGCTLLRTEEGSNE